MNTKNWVDLENLLPTPAFSTSSITLSGKIVDHVRQALFEGRLRPGDALATEKELAARFGVSRIVARDALKQLDASGIVDIRVGAGGGARISSSNPQRLGDALAVQLNLIGASVSEIMDAQRAVEMMTAELAAKNATEVDFEKLSAILDKTDEYFTDAETFARLSLAFHLAIADGSKNKVLRVQLISLQHVAWPTRNHTITPDVAEHVQKLHRELYLLIKARDGDGARELMSRHIRQIRARRLADQGDAASDDAWCC